MYPGSSFSHFEILTLLGEGSYAKVFKARDIRDGREVAIKILHAHLASLENVRTRFLREADVQTKLYHPNIVKVFEIVEDQGSVGMVMELIEGKTLAEAIARQKHMPFDQIARIMDQILDAVGYAHSHQIVHRDLKPSNVLKLADGTVKVSDFGIARLLHTQGAGVRTRTGMALGTSYYMSPEQVLGRKDLDHRSDIYALGCILYELLVGHPMFFEFEQQTDDPDFLIKNAHVQQPVPDPQKERPDIPAGLIAILKQALAKKPEDRYDECAEMRIAIKKLFKSRNTQESATLLTGDHKTAEELTEGRKDKKVTGGGVIEAKKDDPFLVFDEKKAVELWQISANQGNSEAQWRLGRAYGLGLGGLTKDEKKAIELYQKSANQGNSNAQWRLGRAYELGLGGLTKDKKKAVDLYQKSADQGNTYGQCCLGIAYFWGLGGLTKDEKKAVDLLQKSAAQGNIEAHYFLGRMYHQGVGGLKRDLTNARKHYEIAANAGHEGAKKQLNQILWLTQHFDVFE